MAVYRSHRRTSKLACLPTVKDLPEWGNFQCRLLEKVAQYCMLIHTPVDLISSLRLLQELRSKSAAHRKSSALTDLLKDEGLEDESPREVYRQLILEPMLDYCRRLSEFSENHHQGAE